MTTNTPAPVRALASTRIARGTHIGDLLRAERWSLRQAALAIGMNTSVLASRVKGDTAFTAEEIEAIAQLLRTDPVQFFGTFIAVNEETPAPARGRAGASGLSTFMDIAPRLGLEPRTCRSQQVSGELIPFAARRKSEEHTQKRLVLRPVVRIREGVSA